MTDFSLGGSSMNDPMKILESLVTANRYSHVALDCDLDDDGKREFSAVLYHEPEEERQAEGYGDTLAAAIIKLAEDVAADTAR